MMINVSFLFSSYFLIFNEMNKKIYNFFLFCSIHLQKNKCEWQNEKNEKNLKMRNSRRKTYT